MDTIIMQHLKSALESINKAIALHIERNFDTLIEQENTISDTIRTKINVIGCMDSGGLFVVQRELERLLKFYIADAKQ
jgi:hypothetical protein